MDEEKGKWELDELRGRERGGPLAVRKKEMIKLLYLIRKAWPRGMGTSGKGEKNKSPFNGETAPPGQKCP